MLEEMRAKKLKSRYGVDFSKKDEAPDVITTENYVEYDRKGNVVKGVAEVIILIYLSYSLFLNQNMKKISIPVIIQVSGVHGIIGMNISGVMLVAINVFVMLIVLVKLLQIIPVC